MAEEACFSGESKTCDTREYDPELDFFSDKFNPLKALMTPNVKVPVPNAGAYDNVSKYESEVHRNSAREPKQTTATRTAIDDTTLIERNFLPHQMPIKTEKKIKGNVLLRMAEMKGPLEALKKCVEDRVRIKVYTRNAHEIRGYCLAYVAAFDKHWNMALEDVTEVWTRKRKKKVPALGNIELENLEIKKRKIIPPKVVVKKINKKLEECQRCIPQLLVRGEEVVMVVTGNNTINK